METLITLFLIACMFFAALLFYASGRRRLEPDLARQGRVVAKRQTGDGYYARATYFVTFEFQDGSRDEFETFDRQYGLLAEGDQGTLMTRGRWLKGFARQWPQRGPSFPRPLHT
ncbi:DUF2500 family protein [Corallococcus sp. CA054B]|uniref:DUF2500 domain-containing protein n=1 Tax=unclassified Corallococcus TaxID=2685029 RepID=UPI000EA170D3|nr:MULTISPECIES: DUF2500 domain-containing protein [unclassified Corallococcus]RKG68305.1 DUF2500 family protein [Corallococcus sp. CA054B]RKG75161.1 DUF2500 family protein [Corallococcus sp. CA049B]